MALSDRGETDIGCNEMGKKEVNGVMMVIMVMMTGLRAA